MEHEEQKDPVATSVHSTTSAVDLFDKDSKETLVVEEEETYDAGAFERAEAEVVKWSFLLILYLIATKTRS